MATITVQLKKSKDTPGTHVYTGPKTNDQGKPSAITSVYVNKEAFNGGPVPEAITLTVTY